MSVNVPLEAKQGGVVAELAGGGGSQVIRLTRRYSEIVVQGTSWLWQSVVIIESCALVSPLLVVVV